MSAYRPAREALRLHLVEHALRTDGPFTLRSGQVSDWYLDARRTTFDGEGATLVGQALLEVMDPTAEALGGMTMGADPIAVATAVVAHGRGRHLRAFSVRKEDKTHGTGGRLVGPVRRGDRVVVVEDTTTTGGALSEAIAVVRAHGLVVVQAVALVDRSDGAVNETMRSSGLPYTALFDTADLGV